MVRRIAVRGEVGSTPSCRIQAGRPTPIPARKRPGCMRATVAKLHGEDRRVPNEGGHVFRGPP